MFGRAVGAALVLQHGVPVEIGLATLAVEYAEGRAAQASESFTTAGDDEAPLHAMGERDPRSPVRRGSGLPAARRLQIYRNNLFESLTSALEAVFPVVARLVGERFFRQLARGFIGAHPSRSGNLHEFGCNLPAYLASMPSGLTYLADVAALEWACHEVWHEADETALDAAALGAVPVGEQPRLRLHLQAASRFVASAFPVLRIWQANQSEAAEVPVSLDDGGVQLLVARRDFDVEFRVLHAAEDVWLRALAAGATLEIATARALDANPAFGLAGVLTRHLSLGSFARLSLAAEPDEEPS